MNSALLKGLVALGAGMHAVLRFGRLVLPAKGGLLFATATRKAHQTSVYHLLSPRQA